MAGISKGACVQLILSYIGGNPLFQVPTTTVGGQPVAIKVGFGGFTSAATQIAGLASEAASIASQAAAIASMAGNERLFNDLTGITDQLNTALGGSLTAASFGQVFDQVGQLNDLTTQLGSLSSIALNSDISQQYQSLSGGLTGLNSKFAEVDQSTQKITSLTQLANDVGSSSGGLQEGLSLISKNPLDSSITKTSSKLLSYSTNNYSGLNAAIPQISSNTQLANAYSELKIALGGADGLTGAVAQLNSYKDHTDRLSGISLSSDSDSFQTTESGEETLYSYNLTPNTWNTIISFPAKNFRSAKYFIQGSSGKEHQTSEVFVIHDNTLSYIREVDLIYTRDPFISFTSKFESDTVEVLANTSLSNTDLVIYGVKLEIATPASSKDLITQEKILESAKTMNGFYPDSGTDYVKMQATSLFDPTPLSTLDDTISLLTDKLNSYEFDSLSIEQKDQYLRDYANTINTISKSMQGSIDTDVAAQQEISKKIESASAVFSVSANYSDPKAKALLDLTLNDSVKNNLQ